jgi:sec-independent protein translocase protein TatC
MSILLDTDASSNPQTHLDELSLRVSVWFIAVAALTLVWSLFVDSVLDSLLSRLSPCIGACMNVYDPAEWSAIRWATSLLLALFSALPLMLFHMYQFTKPGLLQSEYRALRQWTSLSSVAFLLVAYGLVFHLLPGIYQLGYEQHLSAGLTAQYDAVHILVVALYVVWISWLFFCTWLLLFLIGTLGLVTQATADWWRLRIYGIGTLLIIVTVPQQTHSLMLPLVTVYMVTMEVVGSRWYRQTSPSLGFAKPRFDGEGRRRTYALIDCSCDGGNAHHGQAEVDGFATVKLVGLCKSREDQEHVYEQVLRSGFTDVMVTGCDTAACPSRFKDNLALLNVELHGLNLMKLQNHRIPNLEPKLDLLLCLEHHLRGSEDVEPSVVLQSVIEEHGFLPNDVWSIPKDSTDWGPFIESGPMFLQ